MAATDLKFIDHETCKQAARWIDAAPHLIAALEVAERALMNATHGDEYAEYEAELKTIREALVKVQAA